MMNIRRDICLGSLSRLPPGSAGYGLSVPEQLSLLKSQQYQGVVHWSGWEEIRAAGLIPCGMGQVRAPEDALTLARAHSDAGLDFTTLHVGTGFESDEEMDRLAHAVIEAAARTQYPLHIETHRATMTQDIRRTLDLIERYPTLSFTLDFSHWYTGHEMTYGGEFAERLAHLDPVFSRVESIQLRMGTSGAIQRPLDPASEHYRHHVTALRRCLEVRLARPGPPVHLSVAPELLPALMGEGKDVRPINYADKDERSDHFEEALTLSSLAEAILDEISQKPVTALREDGPWSLPGV